MVEGFRLSDSALKTEEEINKSVQVIPTPTNNSLVEQKYFNNQYAPVIEEYLKDTNIVLSDIEKRIVQEGIRKKSRGLTSAVPLKCTGSKCPFFGECPFAKIGKAPVGGTCPTEQIVMDMYTKRYIDEFGVMVDSFSEVTTMTMLATTHIMEMRALHALAQEAGATGLIQNVVGWNEEEQPIIQLQEHPAYQTIERAWKWREKLLSSLVGTRKDKYKREVALKTKNTDNSLAMRAADLKSKIDKMAVMSGGMQ